MSTIAQARSKRRATRICAVVVLDRRDCAGRPLESLTLSRELRRREEADRELRRFRELYPAARLEPVAQD